MLNIQINEFERAARSAKDAIFHSNKSQAIRAFGDWAVKAERIYHRSRIISWSPVYYLVSSRGEQFGGYNTLDSFLTWGSRFLRQ